MFLYVHLTDERADNKQIKPLLSLSVKDKLL